MWVESGAAVSQWDVESTVGDGMHSNFRTCGTQIVTIFEWTEIESREVTSNREEMSSQHVQSIKLNTKQGCC